jgi:hypothetical protein
VARYSAPPPALQQAIDSSAKRYGVPPNVLVGIWRVESGSSYPNPYVNSLGYGGLFGTTDWNGPTQAQADLAAKILADNVRSHGGDLGAALSAYSGGGYSSVSGETGRQKLVGVQSVPGDPTSSSGTPAGAPPRPGVGGGGDSGIWGAIESAAGRAAGVVEGGAESAWGAGGSIIGGAEALISGPLDFLKAALWLVNPLTWLRATEAVLGFALLLTGALVASGLASKAEQAVASSPLPILIPV